ncbi:hypothetical protein AS156_31155 [Bradyrhizobium macuxiense]|uniref:Uncharacterized protein n=1 Tax=Bradyrhizobium macuxiense TaxID=1755647 RepID=A0A120FR43_9BRAD|nr:hypothetical protein AS156_31155 [Bradyrhizobium macuxiense]
MLYLVFGFAAVIGFLGIYSVGYVVGCRRGYREANRAICHEASPSRTLEQKEGAERPVLRAGMDK